MKNLKVLFLGFVLLTGSSLFAATYAKNQSNQDEKKTDVNVYYFHTNTRCVTCRAVESETKKNVEELFGDKVRFTAFNLEDEAGETKGKELGVKGTGLLVIKGDKKIELTAQGFMYARTNPDKFRQILKEKIQPLL